MAFRCDVCGKGPVAGKSISHSHKTTNRWFLPNLHQLKITLKGKPTHAKVCTRCVRSNKIQRVSVRQPAAV